ncbi:flagellar basal-body MS-ring/collar protein FliF [Arenimonas sp.]|uniref:flagellar basal-body MS-ring/collar protein FliF n=1 Tax=Arenimonas sp. TaxID=1872635 RepID=UPI0039E6435D
MNAFNEFFRSLGSGARTGFLAGALLIVLGMIAALWWVFSPSYQLLFGDLREADAAEIAQSLTEWKVPYRYTDDGRGIEVPQSQVYDTRMKLVSAGVPSGGHAGFELFDDADFGVTEFAQRVNYQRAIQGELERSIAALPGVQNVRVHLTIRRPGLFVGQDDASKASIVVGMLPGEMLTAAQVRGIRNLVASAVDGLSPAAVVVLGPTGVMPGGGGAGEDSLMSQNEEQSGYEARVRERISDLLSQAFQLRDFRVSVDARVNFDQVKRVSERLLEQGEGGNGLLVRKRVNRSGAAPTADATQAPTTQSQEEYDYAHGSEREETIRAPGRVERLSIAVLVPPGLSSAEIERLRKLITAAAGLDSERGDRLEISALADGPSGIKAIDENPVLSASGDPDKAAVPGTARPSGASGPSRLPGPLWTWIALAIVVGLLGGIVLARLFRSTPPALRPQERDAVLAKMRVWLAEGGNAS